MCNGFEIRLTLALIIVVGSYAERTSDSARMFIFVAAISAVVILVVISFHVLVIDVLSLRKERSSEDYSAVKRQTQLVQLISSELEDVNMDPALLQAQASSLLRSRTQFGIARILAESEQSRYPWMC